MDRSNIGNHGRKKTTLRAEGVYRRLFMILYANKKESFLLTEYPKSGGSWLTEMVAQMVAVDFPRNQFPTQRSSAFQGHYVRSYNQKNVIVLWRDPRDIVISYYHHAVIGNVHANPSHVKQVRKNCGILEPMNVKAELVKFIDLMFSGKIAPLGVTWCDFFDRWFGDEYVKHVKYESLLENANNELLALAEYLGRDVSPNDINRIVEEHSFERKSGRTRGEEDQHSFVRKGVSGDWVNYFNEESYAFFLDKVGDRIERLGY